MFIKICGTTNLEDALLSVAEGADALGFIFAPSKRQVTVEQAAKITRELPPQVERIGVFTQPEVETVADAVRAAQLTGVQMHWRHDGEVVAALRAELGPKVQLWQVVGYQIAAKSLAAADDEFVRALRGALLDPAVDVVLLDTEKGKASGGTGQPFPWANVAALLQCEAQGTQRGASETQPRRPPLFLAGGLTANNVLQACEILQPAGVDVVSGVEAGPGIKAPDRLRAFMAAARRATR